MNDLRKCDTYLLSFIGDDRILIYASSEQLHVLQTARDFLVDRTFKVVPEIFYQLFIIHAVYRHHVVPVVYALLRRKNAETYHRLVDEVVKIAPDWSPASIMMDFEQASINTFQQKFQSAALSGCYFHLRQSIHRKLQVRKRVSSENKLVIPFLESRSSAWLSNWSNVCSQHSQNSSVSISPSKLCSEWLWTALRGSRRALRQYPWLFWGYLYRYFTYWLSRKIVHLFLF